MFRWLALVYILGVLVLSAKARTETQEIAAKDFDLVLNHQTE